MFTTSRKGSAIDSVSAVEGSFKLGPETGEAEIEVTMLYSNAETGLTLGTCPVRETILSDKTKESLRQFIRNVEDDFGHVVFDEGFPVFKPSQQGDIESKDGLRLKGIGE